MDAQDRLRRIAEDGVDVPGAPRSLALDSAGPDPSEGGTLRVRWSFPDPGGGADQVHGSTVVPADADPSEQWRAAQLDAAHALRRHLDLDTRPGEPYVPLRLTVDEAWGLLLAHLGRWHRVVESDGVLRVGDGLAELRTDRATWASYLDRIADDTDSPWVPSAVATDGGLPLWAADELDETVLAGVRFTVADGGVVTDP